MPRRPPAVALRAAADRSRVAPSAATLLALALLLHPGAHLRAQEAAPSGFDWTNATELSYVETGGNASSSTLGAKATVEARGAPHTWRLEAGGVRASSDVRSRRAVGTVDDYVLVESIRSETTAESFFARTRYDRALGVGSGFAFGGLGWERNTFSGVRHRFSGVAGLGRTFIESDAGRLKVDLGLTYTIQKDVAPVPDSGDGFGGVRASLEASRRISDNATLRTDVVLDDNLEELEDLRADILTSLSVAISEGLALKTSLQLLWDNRPALMTAPLESSDGAPLGTTVTIPGRTLDRVVTIALVISL